MVSRKTLASSVLPLSKSYPLPFQKLFEDFYSTDNSDLIVKTNNIKPVTTVEDSPVQDGGCCSEVLLPSVLGRDTHDSCRLHLSHM